MTWDVEYTDEFGIWWASLTEPEHESIAASVGLLECLGPNLRFPHTSGIGSSKHAHMRELRVQHAGRPYRVLFAFDPRRSAIFYCWAAIRPAMTAGTRKMFRLQIIFTMCIWRRLRRSN